jgi:hypothetical protein
VAIPDNANEETPMHCGNCGGCLGHWEEQQRTSQGQMANAESIDLNHGTITRNG